jgi:hypothetical protein
MIKKKRIKKIARLNKGKVGYLVCPYCDKVLLFADKEIISFLKKWRNQSGSAQNETKRK